MSYDLSIPAPRMLMRTATTIKCCDVGDLDDVEIVTVECYRCDPDNPLAVPRESCPECHGTGRSPIALVPILREIRESMTQPAKKRSHIPVSDNDDLNLEY